MERGIEINFFFVFKNCRDKILELLRVDGEVKVGSIIFYKFF